MTIDTNTPTPAALPCGMSTTEFQDWYAEDAENAQNYAIGRGVDPVTLGCLPGGMTPATFEALMAQNPFFGAKYAAEHRLYERGYKRAGQNMSSGGARLAALRHTGAR